jgi:hypothetical protein
MPNTYGYDVVDVFTDVPLEGNALAVFSDGRGLDGSTMQRIARELNLSETTFLLPPTIPDAASSLRRASCNSPAIRRSDPHSSRENVASFQTACESLILKNPSDPFRCGSTMGRHRRFG